MPLSWSAACRRLHRRYELKAEHFLAFMGVIARLIGDRRLCGPSSATSEPSTAYHLSAVSR
ncbi:hypothetical protein ACFW9L_07500 [Streptomyces sp. NPDC059517]|uniref:hypothetical protein n=1 Tax=Streptomyces sp. NPDC059517 TaxID=3346855 RepID=UPI0036A18E34